jgi:hypothetical protein
VIKKKVAVQLTGYIRTFFECFDSWSNLLDYDMYDFEFFIHTYKKHGFSKGFNTEIDCNDEIDIEKIKKNIKVIRIVVEDDNFDNYGEKMPIWGHYKNRVNLMFRKFFLCNEIFKDYVNETGENYEYVIRMRPDLVFYEKVNLYKPKENTIIFNKYVYHRHYIDPSIGEGLNDQIAICSIDSIDKYSNIFNSEHIVNTQPETALHRHIKDKSINIELIDLKMYIKRKDE